jgi:sec-independent protein translocase protein TatB
MLDLGLSKLALIGVVALVVIGPEKLPRVARTAGALMGRAQRYINDVKAEVSRELELEELRKMKTEFETAAHNVESTIHDNLRKHEASLNEAWNAGDSVAPSLAGGHPENTIWRPTSTPKRRSWRVRQAALPAWYKRASFKRTRVQSGAARVARHTPASLRRPTRFF